MGVRHVGLLLCLLKGCWCSVRCYMHLFEGICLKRGPRCILFEKDQVSLDLTSTPSSFSSSSSCSFHLKSQLANAPISQKRNQLKYRFLLACKSNKILPYRAGLEYIREAYTPILLLLAASFATGSLTVKVKRLNQRETEEQRREPISNVSHSQQSVPRMVISPQQIFLSFEKSWPMRE